MLNSFSSDVPRAFTPSAGSTSASGRVTGAFSKNAAGVQKKSEMPEFETFKGIRSKPPEDSDFGKSREAVTLQAEASVKVSGKKSLKKKNSKKHKNADNDEEDSFQDSGRKKSRKPRKMKNYFDEEEKHVE
jgi:hypothetical protein